MRVSLIQSELHWHDGPANRDSFAGKIRDLAGSTDLVVLPEMFSSGFTNDTDMAAEDESGKSLEWMLAMAQECQTAVCGSVVHPQENGYANRCYFVEPQGKVHHYDKVHLFRMADEHKKYQAGDARLVVDYLGWKILLTVCYDLRFPVFLRNRVSSEHQLEYDLMLCVANWPAARATAWRTLLQARAMENLSYVAGVNRVGVDGNDIQYAGDSMLLDFQGRHVIDHAAGTAFVETAELSKQKLKAFRKKFPAHLDADEFTLEIKRD